MSWKVRVRHGDKEIEAEIPLSDRSCIGLDKSNKGTGHATIEMIKQMIEQLNTIE